MVQTNVLPDHPPSIQQLVNNLHGLPQVQRDLVVLFRLVGVGGDVKLSFSDTMMRAQLSVSAGLRYKTLLASISTRLFTMMTTPPPPPSTHTWMKVLPLCQHHSSGGLCQSALWEETGADQTAQCESGLLRFVLAFIVRFCLLCLLRSIQRLQVRCRHPSPFGLALTEPPTSMQQQHRQEGLVTPGYT